MKKNNSYPYETPDNRHSSYFGVVFQNIEYTTLSAFYISNTYKILSIIFYLLCRIQTSILKIPLKRTQKNIRQALHAGHTYGMFYYNKDDRQWIDTTCKEKNINPTEKILFGFGGVFKVRTKTFSLGGIPWFEKSIYITLTTLILGYSLILIPYSYLIILSKDSLQTILSLILFWIIYTYACFILIQIMKGSCWDANNLFKKYR